MSLARVRALLLPLIIGVLACTGTAQAAPAFVQGASSSTSGTTMNVSYGSGVGAGHLLVGMFRTAGTTSVSDSLNGAWTKAVGTSDGLNSIWYRPNARAGTTTVTVSGTASASIRAVIAEYSGVATTTPLDGTACNTGTGTSATTGSTASVPAGELAFAGVGMFDSPITVSAGTGATLRNQLTGANGTSADEDVASTAAGAQNRSFGLSTAPPGGWAACIATFRPPTASGPADWVGSFTGGISSSLYPFQSFVTGHVFSTADPAGSGTQVAAFAIDNSDQPYAGSLPRGDLFEYNAGSSNPVFTPGKNYYISIPVRIPAGLPLMFDNGSKFLQWAQINYPGKDGHPALGLSIGGGEVGYPTNHFSLEMYDNGAFDYPWYGPAVDGNWHTVILFVHFATDNTGYVQLWFDGVQQTFSNGLTTFSGPTLTASNDGQYHDGLDIDSYRAFNAMPGTVTIYHGAPAIGPTYASVYNTLTRPPTGP